MNTLEKETVEIVRSTARVKPDGYTSSMYIWEFMFMKNYFMPSTFKSNTDEEYIQEIKQMLEDNGHKVRIV